MGSQANQALQQRMKTPAAPSMMNRQNAPANRHSNMGKENQNAQARTRADTIANKNNATGAVKWGTRAAA